MITDKEIPNIKEIMRVFPISNVLLKQIFQELRKRNPYEYHEEDDGACNKCGYEKACNELEKMEREE